MVVPPRIVESVTVASWSGSPRTASIAIHSGYTMKCVGSCRGPSRGGARSARDVTPRRRPSTGASSFAREADDVERRALAEVGDGAGVVDADAGRRVEVLLRPAPQRHLLAVDAARGLRDVVDHPVELRDEEAHDAAAEQARDHAPARADRAGRIPREPGEAREADDPTRGERPEVAQAVPEEGVVEARREHRERQERRRLPPASATECARPSTAMAPRPAIATGAPPWGKNSATSSSPLSSVPTRSRAYPSTAPPASARVVRVAGQELRDGRVAASRSGECPQKEGRREHRARRQPEASARLRHAGPRGKTASVAATKRAVTAPSGRKSAATHASATSSALPAAGAVLETRLGPLARPPRSARDRPRERHDLHPARGAPRRSRRTRAPWRRRRWRRGAPPSRLVSAARLPREAAEREERQRPRGPDDRLVAHAERPERREQGRPEQARRAARDGRAGLEAQRVALAMARAYWKWMYASSRAAPAWPTFARTAAIVRWASSATATTTGPYARARSFQMPHGSARAGSPPDTPGRSPTGPSWSRPPFPFSSG